MPTITLYIKEADQPLVEKAKKKLGDSMSAVFIDCLRQRLEQLPKGNTNNITVELRIKEGARTIRKTFQEAR